MEKIASDKGYCPLELSAATEKVVVDGNRRKYVQLGRSLSSMEARRVPQRSGVTCAANSVSLTSPYSEDRETLQSSTGVQWSYRRMRSTVRKSQHQRQKALSGKTTCSSYWAWSSR